MIRTCSINSCNFFLFRRYDIIVHDISEDKWHYIATRINFDRTINQVKFIRLCELTVNGCLPPSWKSIRADSRFCSVPRNTFAAMKSATANYARCNWQLNEKLCLSAHSITIFHFFLSRWTFHSGFSPREFRETLSVFPLHSDFQWLPLSIFSPNFSL